LLSLAQAVLDGVMIGGVYAIISIGLTLVFGVMGIVNFAQAQFLMVGMFVAFFAWNWLGIDPLIGCVIAFAVSSRWAGCCRPRCSAGCSRPRRSRRSS
jgi:branched-chain amino acid transport system permease protein